MGYDNPMHDFDGIEPDPPIDMPMPQAHVVPKGNPRRTRTDDDFQISHDPTYATRVSTAFERLQTQKRKRKCNKTLKVPSTTAGEPPTIYRCSRPVGHETFDHPSHQAPTQHEESGHIRFKGQTNLTLYTMQWHEVGAFTWRQE